MQVMSCVFSDCPPLRTEGTLEGVRVANDE